jgi:hypothetical protein
LLARVRGDNELLTKAASSSSNTCSLRDHPAKQEIMRAAVQREIGSMVDASRLAVASQLNATKAELQELAVMSGKSRGMAQTMVARLEVDRKNYHATVQTFRATVNTSHQSGATLLKQLDDDRLDDIQQGPQVHRGRVDDGGLVKVCKCCFSISPQCRPRYSISPQPD